MTRAIRIAVPKGRLMSGVLELARDAGLGVPEASDLETRRLVHRTRRSSTSPEIEWVLVKDADVTTWVEHGGADAGFVGLDQILEHEPDVYQPIELSFGRCRMMLIGAAGAEPLTHRFRGRVASKYPRYAASWLARRAPDAEVVALNGSVELAAALGLAPYIVDLVETGETIRAHDLTPVEELARIEPRMIVNKSSYRVLNGPLRDVIEKLRRAVRTDEDPRSADPSKETEVIA